jgi:acetoin utilization protein AcuC
VTLAVRPGRGDEAGEGAGAVDDILRLEIADNAFSGVDLNLIVINDPGSPRFRIDRDEAGRQTLFGTARRNLAEEERAMRAGLAPAQGRASLRASRQVLEQLEAFLAALGQRVYFLEPLTYASAWLFERRGFAYVRGHKLMDDIQAGFQPGGPLHQALDGSSPFRQPDGGCSVRGRAWAIHDGILESIGARWDGLRMVKQIGRSAGVETFPGAVY